MIAFELIDLEDKGTFVEFTSANEAVEKGKPIHVNLAFDKLRFGMGQGFKRATVHLEDTILVFPNGGKHGDEIVVSAFDLIEGRHIRATWTYQQTIAVLTLAFLGDEISKSEEFYKIAEPAVLGWPNSLRPIP